MVDISDSGSESAQDDSVRAAGRLAPEEPGVRSELGDAGRRHRDHDVRAARLQGLRRRLRQLGQGQLRL